MHDHRFPNESPAYRQARDQLLEAEIELRRNVERVAAQRRELPVGGEVPEDYLFMEGSLQTGEGREVRLSELFSRDRDTLILTPGIRSSSSPSRIPDRSRGTSTWSGRYGA